MTRTQQQTVSRRTSQYTLTIPGPDHADADVQAALDALVAAVPAVLDEIVQGAYITRPDAPGAAPTLSVCWRANSDLNARVGSLLVCRSLDVDDATAALHTGYGISRRDFPVRATEGVEG